MAQVIFCTAIGLVVCFGAHSFRVLTSNRCAVRKVDHFVKLPKAIGGLVWMLDP